MCRDPTRVPLLKKAPSISTVVMATALVVLVALGIAFGSSGGDHAAPNPTGAVVAKVRPIAERVQTVRGLRFKTIPKPVVVTPQQTREAQLKDLDRSYPAAQRRADAELLELLGLVPSGTDLRKVLGDVSGEQVAGYYDTRRKRLAVVSGDTAGNAVLAEITLSHELDHALDDQHFHLKDSTGGTDDSGSAYTALVEGTATEVMDLYAQRYLPPGSGLLSALAALGPAASGTQSIPPYLQSSLEFSYTGGESFVQALRRAGGGTWRLVNRALGKRPPVSTEQIMHPEKYLKGERPLPVRIGPLGLGAGWKRAERGSVGEFDTRALLKLGTDSATAANAAAGWGGGRFELWTNAAAAAGCSDPCRRADALVMRWRWDTPNDAREFDAALPLYLVKGLSARAAGPAQWSVGDGGAAIGVRGDSTTLAFAPSPQQAAALAARHR